MHDMDVGGKWKSALSSHAHNLLIPHPSGIQ